jgi:putative redox protein
MSEESMRRVGLTRLAKGRYQATNSRGGTLVLGSGDDDATFTPVELLLTAIAGCSAADVDFITSKRAEPVRFEVRMSGDKVRDGDGNHLQNLTLVFDIGFPDGEAGDAAREVLPRAMTQSHDRLCTVSRTVELGTPVRIETAG